MRSENTCVSSEVVFGAWASWHDCRKPTYKNLGLVANPSFVVPRTEKVRKVLLELDDTTSTVESLRIKCTSCQQWVFLEEKYSLKSWAAHKFACNNNLEYIISYHPNCLSAHPSLKSHRYCEGTWTEVVFLLWYPIQVLPGSSFGWMRDLRPEDRT